MPAIKLADSGKSRNRLPKDNAEYVELLLDQARLHRALSHRYLKAFVESFGFTA